MLGRCGLLVHDRLLDRRRGLSRCVGCHDGLLRVGVGGSNRLRLGGGVLPLLRRRGGRRRELRPQR
ncbi:hypothetical protein JK361_37195 [Streptomyces sp. 5-8]|uniref:Uncharacterized protein n=1 Tax=Streptomyces musisoli TaxID=2802280 RepID=A0ABS1PDL2_9ACTN|nr:MULTISPECIES: hypothetical protein [Streptomyces]MBL1110137.1 hypothetical protein [Streptomyces musisoli]MBY8845983.1 hypothetical protein [Streptomyces sp. SP2-10]